MGMSIANEVDLIIALAYFMIVVVQGTDFFSCHCTLQILQLAHHSQGCDRIRQEMQLRISRDDAIV